FVSSGSRRTRFKCDWSSDVCSSDLDEILRNTLTCFEDGAIEHAALTAFNIALEQFHNAVADRKLILMSMPANLQRTGAQLRAAAIGRASCRDRGAKRVQEQGADGGG